LESRLRLGTGRSWHGTIWEKQRKPSFTTPCQDEPRGNTFWIIETVARTLRERGFIAKTGEFLSRIKQTHSYDKMKAMCKEYLKCRDPEDE